MGLHPYEFVENTLVEVKLVVTDSSRTVYFRAGPDAASMQVICETEVPVDYEAKLKLCCTIWPASNMVLASTPSLKQIDTETTPGQAFEFRNERREWSPVHEAVYMGDVALLNKLLEKGADPGARQAYGTTGTCTSTVQIACSVMSLASLEPLEKYGARNAAATDAMVRAFTFLPRPDEDADAQEQQAWRQQDRLMRETRVSLVRMAGELGPQHLHVLLDMTSIREAVLEELEEWEKRLLENNLHSGAIEMIAWQDIKYIDLSAVRSGGFRNFMEAIWGDGYPCEVHQAVPRGQRLHARGAVAWPPQQDEARDDHPGRQVGRPATIHGAR